MITDDHRDRFEDCITVFSIDEVLQQCDEDKESFVIGGASVYRQFLPLASRLYLTLIHKKFEADTFFPVIDYSQWIEESREVQADMSRVDFAYEYVVLHRKN